MLTKNDLKQIRQVVKEEVQGAIQPVEKRLSKRIDELDDKVGSLDKKIAVLDKKVDSLDKKIDSVNRKLDKFDEEMGYVVEYIKKDQHDTKKRIERIEDHLELPHS